MRKLIPIILAAVLLLSTGCANKTEQPLSADVPAPAASTGEEKTGSDETEPDAYSNITVSVRRNAETVSERSITGEAETRMVQDIIVGHMVRSAAWEGIEVSELEECIVLSFDPDGGFTASALLSIRDGWQACDTGRRGGQIHRHGR